MQTEVPLRVIEKLVENNIAFSVHYPTAGKSLVITVSDALNPDQLAVLTSLRFSYMNPNAGFMFLERLFKS